MNIYYQKEKFYFKMNRRIFLKKSFFAGLLLGEDLFASNHHQGKYHFIMPPKPFEYHIKEGKEKGGKILIIGGIHGNEEGGYKASDILIDTKIKKGTVAILARSNPESIFTNIRGYNGDMNRKFAHISKRDRDYYKVNSIKNFINDFKPDLILSLHDGYGFYRKYHNQWGESIVIDEAVYNHIPLYNIAKRVSKHLQYHKLSIPIHNTKTFEKITRHKEQRKSLTYYALESHNIPAFCIEASKQTHIKRKVNIHLRSIEKFFELYNVSIEPSFDYIISNLDKYLISQKPKIIAHINNEKIIIQNHKVLKIPPTEIKFEIQNTRGGGLIARSVNVNYSSFHYRNNIKFYVKNDNKTIFTFKIIKG